MDLHRFNGPCPCSLSTAVLWFLPTASMTETDQCCFSPGELQSQFIIYWRSTVGSSRSETTSLLTRNVTESVACSQRSQFSHKHSADILMLDEFWNSLLIWRSMISKLLYGWRSVSQSACLGIEHPCGTCGQILLPVGMLLSEICGLVRVGRPLWPEDASEICSVITQWSESLSKFEVTLRLTVSQQVLVSSTLVGLATRYYYLSECCCLKFAVLFLWAPSLTRGWVCNLQCNHSIVRVTVEGRSYFTTDSQSAGLGIEHPCGTCDQILLPVGMSLSVICGLVSVQHPLWREDESEICSVITRWSESRRTHNHSLLSHTRLHISFP
jgi:hypothetical protein